MHQAAYLITSWALVYPEPFLFEPGEVRPFEFPRCAPREMRSGQRPFFDSAPSEDGLSAQGAERAPQADRKR